VVLTLTAHVAVVTTTTVAKAAGRTRPSALVLTIGIIALGVGFGLAYLRRRIKGNPPWRLSPALWAAFFLVTGGFAIILLAIAWFTTNDSLPPRQSRYSRIGQPVAMDALRKMSEEREGAAPRTMVPGTYGTSLPPHQEANGTAAGGDGTRAPARSNAAGPAAVTAANKPAGWRVDPTGRHELRYWSGAAWTKHVSDEGKRSVDPL
jgi:hypothetical protein